MKTITVTSYNDPGHGWLAVKRDLLEQLGIADKISTYSYQRGATAYLEEDCDASVFFSAAQAAGLTLTLKHKYCDRRSPIRSYDCYRRPAPVSHCDSCGSPVVDVIGTPDGSELCRLCFDSGAH